jgi:hypothetical protein
MTRQFSTVLELDRNGEAVIVTMTKEEIIEAIKREELDFRLAPGMWIDPKGCRVCAVGATLRAACQKADWPDVRNTVERLGRRLIDGNCPATYDVPEHFEDLGLLHGAVRDLAHRLLQDGYLLNALSVIYEFFGTSTDTIQFVRDYFPPVIKLDLAATGFSDHPSVLVNW